LLVFYAPGRNVNRFNVLRVDGDVVEDKIVGTQMGKSRPTVTAIGRLKNASRTGPKVDMIRAAGIVAQAANIATIRA